MKLFIIRNFFFAFVLLFILLASLSQYILHNQNEIKSYLLNYLKKNIELDFSYSKEELEFFPNLGVRLQNLKLSIPQEGILSEIQDLHVTISWWGFLHKNIQIKSLEINSGYLNYSLQPSNSKTVKSKNSKLKNPSWIFNLSNLKVKKFDIKILENSNQLEQIYLEELEIFSSLGGYNSYVIAYHRGGTVQVDLELASLPKVWDLKELEFEANFKLKDYSILSFKKYYKYFVSQDFDKLRIHGSFIVKKKKGSNEILTSNTFTIYNLNFRNIPPSPPLEIGALISINFTNWKIQFQNAQVHFGEIVTAETSGYLDLDKKKVTLYLDIHAKTCTLEKLIDIIMGFTEIQISSLGYESPDFYGKFSIEANSLSFHNYTFRNTKGILEVDNSILNLQVQNANFYDGKVTGNGKIIVTDKTLYDFSVVCSNINSESLIQRYTPTKYITGNLSGDFQLRSQGIYYNEFLNELQVFGNFQVSNGKLLGYANFFKPIFAIGKYLNWNGPKGDSTGFETLSGNFNLFKKNIEFTNLNLKGVGLDAKGSGKIGLDNSIDLKITVSLGGVAGKIVSVPIIYRGVMPKNLAYIDPIWLGSVYLGFTITGTPYGGVAGSALNEYIEKGIDSVKSLFQNIFSKDDNK